MSKADEVMNALTPLTDGDRVEFDLAAPGGGRCGRVRVIFTSDVFSDAILIDVDGYGYGLVKRSASQCRRIS